MNIERLIDEDILRDPISLNKLYKKDNYLICSESKNKYPIIKGKPVFKKNPNRVKNKEDVVSHEIPDSGVELLKNTKGLVLHISAGASNFRTKNTVELEIDFFKNTDVIADVHKLPFKDKSFDAVIGFNNFEHYLSPETVVNEIFRVLKPGGTILISTAFLQPFHADPYHYYNATESGIRNWFYPFNIEYCKPTPNFNPSMNISWIIFELIDCIEKELGKEKADIIRNSNWSIWENIWNKMLKKEPLKNEDKEYTNILFELSEDVIKKYCGGFELKASKTIENVSINRSHANFETKKLLSENSNFNSEIDKLENQINNLKKSISYKIGTFVTYIPRKFFGLLRKIKLLK